MFIDKRRKPYTEVVKTVQIGEEDCKRWKRGLKLSEYLRDRLSLLVGDLLAGAAEDEEEVWEEIAAAAGYKDRGRMHKEDMCLEISWAKQEIRVLKRPGASPESATPPPERKE